MNSNSCKVCGGNDLNLVDGFYYCTECGTQDVNVRETVVEHSVLADGTFAHATTKKLTTVLEEANEMSGEWNKWHAYNFILAGLTEELLELGAEQSVKTAVLWIWTKYIKKFQVKENDINKSEFVNDKTMNESTNKDEDSCNSNSDCTNDTSISSKKKHKSKSKKFEKFRRDIKIVTKGTLLTILYVALNIEKSDIQLSQLLRFIKEGSLSLYSCTKFVPKEINVKSIPHWKNFIRCQNEYTPKNIRALAMTFFKRLDIGVPYVPDLNKMISTYVKELCLPCEFKNLVVSLMNLFPCDFLNINSRMKKALVRIPDYESACMSYVLIALKMCFGLDSEYEIKVSDAVDKINNNKVYLKSYKLGSYSDATDRLFSFQDWYKFLLFRKIILCKYYLPMARLYKQSADDSVLMEHLKERKTRKITLSDNVTMDILNKIPLDSNVSVIPKSEFPATLTPMSTYTEVILQYLQDPDLRLLLSEDFSQYSLKYAISDLKLPKNDDDAYAVDDSNIIQGVSETNKTINPFIIGSLKSSSGDNTMVFVRNCKNKHWLVTKPPTNNHVVKLNENKQTSDKESDHGYDSNVENPANEIDETQEMVKEDMKQDEHKKEEEIFEAFDEETEGVCIFDDDFKDIENMHDDNKDDTFVNSNSMENYQNDFIQDSKIEFSDGSSIQSSSDCFNIEKFNRNILVNKCIEIACQKYKIPMPTEKPSRLPIKRKPKTKDNEANQIEVKRQKIDMDTEENEPKRTAKDILNTYYKILDDDVLNKVSEHVKSVIYEQNNHEITNNGTFRNNEYEDNRNNILETDKSKAEENDIVSHAEDNQNASLVSSICFQNDEGNSMSSNSGEEGENLIAENDPNFDASTHEIGQLYVKLSENIDLKNSINYESDPELNDLLDKIIENYTVSTTSTNKMAKQINNETDSDDDIPLSEIAREKLSIQEKRILKNSTRKEKSKYLVSNRKLKKFNYWMRHYRSRAVTRSLDMNEKFDIEITESCPKSFVFVISECAAILDCTTFCLYKCMQNLEETFSSFCDK